MGRKILFITADQQRFDALGCTGGTVAKTPRLDAIAAQGLNFRRAHNQNVVCMPARSTMLTGQLVRTHGVICNGIPLPLSAPSIAEYLKEKAGYRTALLGKAHFQPGMDLFKKWEENYFAGENLTGPYRGFERVEFAMHGAYGRWHYCRWLEEHFPEEKNFYSSGLLMPMAGEGDTGAPECKHNPIPIEHYHTAWVARRTINFLRGLSDDEDWFVWVSFPDPHHPWDPPEDEALKIDWRYLDLPAGHPGSLEKCREILAQKPHHWLDWFEGRFVNIEGGSNALVPSRLTHDMLREITSLIAAENQLIDRACGEVFDYIASRGWDSETDIFYTSDHGDLQGDFGLLYKGPYHADGLMRVPFLWRPAPAAKIKPAEIAEPVGHVDLAPTFCEIAGVPIPDWIEGKPLPTAKGSGRERVITEWDSQFPSFGMHLRSLYRDNYLITAYEPGPLYEGTEGELYNCKDDPHQWRNLWNDPEYQKLKKDLLADLYDNLPAPRNPPLEVEAPV